MKNGIRGKCCCKLLRVLKCVCERGLALRGESEEVDFIRGNFLVALEFEGKFYPFLAKRLETRENGGHGVTAYLSSTIYEEIILTVDGKDILGTVAG